MKKNALSRLALVAGFAALATATAVRADDLHKLEMGGWQVRQDNGNFLPAIGTFFATPQLSVTFTDTGTGDVRLDIVSSLDDPTLYYRAFNFNFAPLNGDITTIDTRPLPLGFTRLAGFQDFTIAASSNSAGPGGSATGTGGGIGKTDVWFDLTTGASSSLRFAGSDSMSFLIHRTDGVPLDARAFDYDAISGTANHTGRFFGAFIGKLGVSNFGTFAANETLASLTTIAAPIPEPSTSLLTAFGVAALTWRRRARR